MTLAAFLFFLPACFALNLAPGPNNVLLLNNTTRFGFRTATLAGTGRLWAFAILILLASLGLATVLAASVTYITALKIIGGLYLIWLASKLWRSPVANAHDARSIAAPSMRRLMLQEFICAISNPKAILIFTAIFPQFLDVHQPLAMQFIIMGTTFIVLEWVTIAIYAYIGLHLRKVLQTARGQRNFNRASGGLLGAVGLALLTSRS